MVALPDLPTVWLDRLSLFRSECRMDSPLVEAGRQVSEQSLVVSALSARLMEKLSRKALSTTGSPCSRALRRPSSSQTRAARPYSSASAIAKSKMSARPPSATPVGVPPEARIRNDRLWERGLRVRRAPGVERRPAERLLGSPVPEERIVGLHRVPAITAPRHVRVQLCGPLP